MNLIYVIWSLQGMAEKGLIKHFVANIRRKDYLDLMTNADTVSICMHIIVYFFYRDILLNTQPKLLQQFQRKDYLDRMNNPVNTCMAHNYRAHFSKAGLTCFCYAYFFFRDIWLNAQSKLMDVASRNMVEHVKIMMTINYVYSYQHENIKE